MHRLQMQFLPTEKKENDPKILLCLEYLFMVLEENSFLMLPKSQVITVFHPAMSFSAPVPQILNPASPLSLGLW